MGLKKYKLGELIAQRREKYDGKEELQSWGVSRDGLRSHSHEGLRVRTNRQEQKQGTSRLMLIFLIIASDFEKKCTFEF